MAIWPHRRLCFESKETYSCRVWASQSTLKFSATQKGLPTLYGNQIRIALTTIVPLDFNLRQTKSTPSPLFLHDLFNIILLCMHKSSKWSLPPRLSSCNFFINIPCVLYVHHIINFHNLIFLIILEPNTVAAMSKT
jgi:hypothetical protein